MAICEVEVGHSASLAVSCLAEDEIDRFEVSKVIVRRSRLSLWPFVKLNSVILSPWL